MSNARSPRNVVGSLHPTRQQLDELDALLKRMLELPVNRVEDQPGEPASGGGPAPRTLPIRPVSREVPPQAEPAENQDLAETGPSRSESEAPASLPLPVQPPHRFRKQAPPQPPPEAEEPVSATDGDWVPFRSSWQPSPHTWPPLAESWAQAQKNPERARVRLDGPAVESARREVRPGPAPRPPELPAPLARTAEASAEPPAQVETPSETLIYPRPLFGSAPSEGPPSQAIAESRNPAEASLPVPDSSPAQEVLWVLRPLVWINRTYEVLVGWAGPPGRWLAGPRGKTFLGLVGVLCLLGAVGLAIAGWLGWTL